MVIDIKDKFTAIDKLWTPYIAAQVNDHYVKFAKLHGSFVWHEHPGEDELFLVISGTLFIEFRDQTVRLEPGQMYVVPKGVEHKPYTGPDGAEVILFEPMATKHTGEKTTDRTVEQLEWI